MVPAIATGRAPAGWPYVRADRKTMARRLPWSPSHRNRFDPAWRESGFFILAVLDKKGLYGGHKEQFRPDGPIAQLDRVTDFYSVGCRFESCWDRHHLQRREHERAAFSSR